MLQHAGDVYAAICCFGICAVDNTVESLNKAATDESINEIENVQRRLITGCSVDFDACRSAELYEVSHSGEVVAMTTEDGVVTTKFTGAGAHFCVTDPSIASAEDRMQNAVDHVIKTYCRPTDEQPSHPASIPLALDNQDCVYVIDQGHVNVPVLEYNNTLCIDYTSSSVVEGIKVIDNVFGEARECTTRDLYSSLEIPSFFAGAGRPIRIGGDIVVKNTFSRAIPSMQEPKLSSVTCSSSIFAIMDWLCSLYHEQQSNSLMIQYNSVNLNVLDESNEGAQEHAMIFADKAMVPVLDNHLNSSDRSLLGGPMPFMIVQSGQPLAGTVRVAPLSTTSTSFTQQVEHSGAVDTNALAERMSRTGCRNVIGVAMQKINPNTQGDIMLHDGV